MDDMKVSLTGLGGSSAGEEDFWSLADWRARSARADPDRMQEEVRHPVGAKRADDARHRQSTVRVVWPVETADKVRQAPEGEAATAAPRDSCRGLKSSPLVLEIEAAMSR
jgi:hypothetical protein